MSKIVEKSKDLQRQLGDRSKKIGKGRFGRVLRMARKPTPDEFSRVIVVTGLGLILIGALGFFIYLMMTAFPAWIGSLLK